MGRIQVPPPKLTLSQWSDGNRYLPAESSAEPGRWRTDRVEYLRGVMDAISEPTIETVVFKKASQVGASEVAVNAIGYFIDHDPSPMLMFQPRDKDAEDFSKDRIAPTIRDTPCLRAKISDPKSRDSGNTILHKNFPGGKLVIGSAQSPAGLSSHSVRFVNFDEVDRYERSAGTEGDPIDLGRTRARNFWNRKFYLSSSPKTKLLSRIEPAWLESDQRFFFVPCNNPKCGHPHRLTFENFVYEAGKPETAALACPQCGHRHRTHERNQIVKRCAPDADGRRPIGVDGMPIGWRATQPFRGVAGFHISAFYSPWVTLKQIAEMWEKAKDVPERRQVFINTVLGECYEETSDEFEWSVLAERAEEYPYPVPFGVLALTAGVDTQPDRLECEIVGWNEHGESWNIEYFVIYGDPDIESGQADSPWDELLQVVKERGYRHACNYELRVYATAIDSGGRNTSAVYNFCKGRKSQRIFAIKGVSGEDKPIAGTPNRKKTGKSRRQVDLYPVGVDQAKATLYRRFKVETPGRPGYCHFPKARTEDFFKQIASETVVTRFVKGFPRREWTLPSGQRNEALDCRVYAMAAMEIVRPPWDRFIRIRTDAMKLLPEPPYGAPEARVRPVSPPVAPNAEGTPGGEEEEKPQTLRPKDTKHTHRRRRNSFVNSW